MTTATEKPSQPRRMLALLRSQRDGYRQLVELGRQQAQLIDAGHPEQLLALLSQRQAMIDELTDLGDQISPFHRHWPEISAELDEPDTQQVRDLVDEVEKLLAAILEQDERDRARLASAHKQTGKQLNTTAAAPRALGAYKAAAAPSPRFTDRQG